MDKKYAEYYKKLGLNIAYYRNMVEMTQEQLGDKLGIEQSHVSRIERAYVGISFDMLFEIADALGVEPYKLLQFRD